MTSKDALPTVEKTIKPKIKIKSGKDKTANNSTAPKLKLKKKKVSLRKPPKFTKKCNTLSIFLRNQIRTLGHLKKNFRKSTYTVKIIQSI